jgi:hypothetical protein
MRRALALILVSAWATACSATTTNEANQANQTNNQASAQAAPPWAVQRVAFEDEREGTLTAWELFREHPGGRVAYRILGPSRRGFGIACNGWERTTSSNPVPVEADVRRNAARESILGISRELECEIGPDVLVGFDAGFAELERRWQAEPLPAVQNWTPTISDIGINRQESDIEIEVVLANSSGALQGDAQVRSHGATCPIGRSQNRDRFPTAGDRAARAAAARALVSRMVAQEVRRCNSPAGTAERWMAGFDEALATAEARLAGATAAE